MRPARLGQFISNIMIRFVFRFVGLWILAAAFIFLIYDGTKAIGSNRFSLSNIPFTSIETSWNAVHSTSLQALEPVIQQRVGPWAWERIATPVLKAPTFLVLGVIAILLILIGRKKKPLIGYARD